MNPPTPHPNTPAAAQPLATRAAQQLQNWEKLRDEMQGLHAQLEYLRLMLKLDAAK